MTDDYAAAVIMIGDKGHLDDVTLKEMAQAPALMHARHPETTVCLCIDGYDDDARSLWDIPEAAEYVRRYAKLAGLNDWRGELFQALDEHSRALLLACDAVNKPHPFELVITQGDTNG